MFCQYDEHVYKEEKTRINVRKSRKIEIVEARDIRRTIAAVNETKRG